MSEVVFSSTDEISNGEMVVKRFGRKKVVVCQFDDKYYAFRDACTHDNKPISGGSICENIVTCPRHGAQFDIITGKVLKAPAITPLEIYPVTIKNDEIKVNLG